jgi:hypothetical protein
VIRSDAARSGAGVGRRAARGAGAPVAGRDAVRRADVRGAGRPGIG